MDFWDFEVHTLKMKKALWCYLLKRRKLHLDTTVICTAAKAEGIDMFNSSTPEAIKVVKHLREELKKHYRNHKTRRDEYLLSKANLESDAGDEEKAKAIRNIKKAERRNQCYRNFKFHQGTGISTQEINRIQIPKLWKTMAEYEEDDEFGWIDPKKVDKDDESQWIIITVPAEIDFFY